MFYRAEEIVAQKVSESRRSATNRSRLAEGFYSSVSHSQQPSFRFGLHQLRQHVPLNLPKVLRLRPGIKVGFEINDHPLAIFHKSQVERTSDRSPDCSETLIQS